MGRRRLRCERLQLRVLWPRLDSVFFRAVGPEEHADWPACGTLRARRGGLEGKHFWGTAQHAATYARMCSAFGDRGPFHVLRVRFRRGTPVPCYQKNQDLIGPAYFVDEDALECIEEIVDLGTVSEAP
jgi:hypothetical protein